MSLELYLVYLATIVVLLAAPGPMTLMTLSTSVRYGHGKALFTVIGSNLAGLIVMALSATGVGALLSSQPVLFEMLKVAGAAYLIWLGVSAWRAKTNDCSCNSFAEQECEPLKLFLKTVMIGISNPKGLIFFAALFPQFLHADQPLLPQLTVLCLTFTAVDFIILNLVAMGGCRLANSLAHPTSQRRFNRACAVVFLALGGSVALA
ncbi:LysE family translocator [Ferrimonas lipolytica]|uniref:LysE family translocator n=1 Tax=Ferrimonas lipolytica TaxID=2724191 RepID=A0A6H1UAH0_9GAMM|nr:LysE family translocator [Ferrimonas lipolytica]QIZ75580.1 LysE family translocator [Ferrimonas lipolytica]